MTVALLASMGVVVQPSAAAAAPVAPQPTGELVLERPDEAAAVVTARLTGKRVRITGLTSETSEFVALPGGRVEATVSAGVVRVRRGGGWVPVDLNLRKGADGSVVPVAHPDELKLSGKRSETSGELAALGAGAQRVAMGWSGALPEPVLLANRATYENVLPDIDLVVEATRDGFEQFVAVKSRAAVSKVAQLSFPLTGQAVAGVSEDADGALKVKDKAGRALVSVPTPEMWDAQVAPDGQSPARRTVVDTTATAPKPPARAPKGSTSRAAAPSEGPGKVELTLRPDLGWLNNPATVFPVTIDPKVTKPVFSTFDTYVLEGDTVGRGGEQDLQLGLLNSNPKRKARSFVHWDTEALRGKQISKATVKFFSFWSHVCTPVSWEIWSTGPASEATRWGSQPTWDAKDGTSTETRGGTGCADGWVSIPGTQFFQKAAAKNQGRAYMGIRATNEGNVNGWKQFKSRNTVDTAHVPQAVVEYTSYPAVKARATTPATTCVTGDGRPFVNTTTPTLSATVADDDGDKVKAWIDVWPVSGPNGVAWLETGKVTSGSVVSATVPAGRLGEGGSYKWRTSADDGSTYSADGRVKESWTSWCEFTVDTVAPGVPAISSEEYPAGQWSGGAGDAGSFTFSPAGANDVVAYEYGLDVNAPTQAVNAEGGAATVTMTPATDGPHTLYVRSRDRAGNRSPIKKHEFNVGKSGLTSPNNGDITAAKTAIAASASIGITEVTYQWRRGDADAWATVPSSDVTYASGGAAVAWPLKANGQQFTKINWDVAKTLNDAEAGPDPLAGPVQIRGAFNGGTTSRPVVITFDRDRMSTALRELGPGSVNALTGNYSIEFQDAALAAANDKINLTRTYNSRRAGVVDPMFGPGWTSSMVVSDSDAAYTGLEVFGSLVQVKLPDSTTIGFAKKSANATSVNYEPQVGAEGTSLQYATGSDSFTLVDGNGNKATFTRRAGDPAGQYTPSLAVAVGSPGTTAYSWERATVDGMVLVRPTRVTAPLPAGVASCETPVRGCRVVTFTYATSTTATGSIESSWGTYHGRLSAVSITAWDPDLDVPAMRTVVVVRYAYDDAGRLRSAWDPRLSWKDGGTERHQLVRYGYNADGILNSIAPAGEEPWQIDYTTIPGDSGKGRLRSVSRSALTAGTAVETVVYQVPTSGVGAPHNLSPGETPRWGQAEVPVDATAFFPATQIPTGTPSTGSLPSSWERATIVYLDANGRNVNTATPGGHLQAAWYDGAGNVTQQLTAANRRRSLDHSLSDTVDKESEIAYTLSTVTVYSADGQRQVETFGPEHDLKLGGGTIVRGRVRQSLSYDEGAPVTETPFDLVTTRVSMVRYWTAGGAVIDADARTTKTGYDWRLRKPTTVVVDPAGLNHVTTNTYDAVGRVASTTQPGADGKAETPSTMKYIYYSAAANASDPQCGHRAEWADMVCRNEPAGSASAAPLRATTRTYDYYQHPRTVVESTTGGRHLRTSTISYDTAGRIHETSVKTAAGLGHAVATSRLVYDQATGRILRTQSVASGTVIAEVVRAYDTLGRMKEYTDADGNVATTTYDLLSRVLVANDGKATQTFEYDGGTERRGLPTKLIDSQAGTFAGQYDDDGELARETWPNGIVVENRGDEAGNPTTIAYERPSCGQADCTLFREKVHHGGHGQRFSNDSTLSAQAFGYDQAGRLTRVADTVSGDCSLRIYGFDSASNRTKMDTYPSDGGECQTTTGTSRTWSHDAADRLTDGNTKYDDLGRTTAVAATDTVTGSAASVEYYANDMVRQITSGSSQSEYVLDVMLTRIREERTGPGATAVRTNHYTNDEDGVAWAAEGGSYVRTVAGLGGVAAFYSAESGTAHWKVTNLHGDFVATVDGTDPGLSSTHETDEFGLARANSQPAGDYGWLGSTLRRAANPAGLMLMGVRLYNPATGRFLTPDRVYAGSANAYDYANQDPVNQSDTSGLAPCRCNIPSWAWTGYFTWWNMSARTLWTSRWYDSSLNWLGRSLMDVLSDEVWGDFDRMQAQYRTRELDQVKCTVIKRYGWGKFKVFSARYLIVEWQQRVRIKYRYKFTKWITPWFYGVWIGYRITDYRYRGSGVYWTF